LRADDREVGGVLVPEEQGQRKEGDEIIGKRRNDFIQTSKDTDSLIVKLPVIQKNDKAERLLVKLPISIPITKLSG
jgi:hypothetical protein